MDKCWGERVIVEEGELVKEIEREGDEKELLLPLELPVERGFKRARNRGEGVEIDWVIVVLSNGDNNGEEGKSKGDLVAEKEKER